MAKKVLLLFSKVSVDEGTTHPAGLTALLNAADDRIDADAAMLEDLLYSFDGDEVDVLDTVTGRSIIEYEAVYFRFWGQTQGHAIAAARFCRLKGIPFVDSEVLRVGSQNKITQYMNLFEAKVPIPKTLIGKPAALLARYRQHGFAFPLIAKGVSATRGADNFKLNDEAAMREVFGRHSDKLFVLQSFVPNNGDWRVVVMGDRVVAVIERVAAGDSHLNNTSQGGTARMIAAESLPQEVLAMSVRAAAFFGRQIAGVDIVHDTESGLYYCFEVNRAPQIEHASFEREKAALLADYLAKL